MKPSLGYLSPLLLLFVLVAYSIFIEPGTAFAQFIISSNELPTSVNIPKKIPIEECTKRRNVIVYGIPAECQQTHENLTQAVLKVLQLAKVTLDVSDIRLIRRLGSTISRSTAVLITFSSEDIKRYVFSHKAYLYGTGYKLELDVPKIISYRYRVLKPLYDRLVKKGANATLIYGKLFINGVELPDCVAEKYLFSTTTKSRTLPHVISSSFRSPNT